MDEKIKPLTIKQAIFVDEILKGANATKAAIAAGVSEKSAKSQGWTWLHKLPAVKAAIEAGRKRIQAAGEYGTEQAMEDADKLIEAARASGNLSVQARTLEFKAKLKGLLIEKHQVQHAGFSVNINERPVVGATTETDNGQMQSTHDDIEPKFLQITDGSEKDDGIF